MKLKTHQDTLQKKLIPSLLRLLVLPCLLLAVVLFGYKTIRAKTPTALSLYTDLKTGKEYLIDTTIIPGSGIGYPFENTKNSFTSAFSETVKEREMIRVSRGEESFTFGTVLAQTFGTLRDASASAKKNTITYKDVFDRVDLSYTVTPERLLEELVVHNRESIEKITEFTQHLDLGKLEARKNDDGSITILKDNTGIVFVIPKPLLYELHNTNVSDDGVMYELTTGVGGATLTKKVTDAGRKWLLDKKRRYPLVIDAVVTIATSTSGNAIGNSFQSKTFFNPQSSNYWSFYYDGSAIAYSSSTDGVTWVARGTLPYNTFHFSLSDRNQTSSVFLSVQCGTDLDICVRKGTIAGTTISWGSEYTALDGTNATTDAYTRPNLSVSRDGSIWVAARKQTAASTFISTVRKSSAVEDPSSWATATTVGSSETYLLDHILIPTTYNNMYMVVNGSGGDKSISGYTYNGTSWSAAVTGGETSSGGGGSVNTDTYGFGTNGSVLAAAVSGSTLYIGGSFTQAGGIPANYIAMWDGTRWSALGGGMSTSAVYSLAVSGTDLYVGGSFTASGGVTTNRIAKWNGTSWSALSTGFTSGTVNALSFTGSTLNAGGTFTLAGTVTVNYIASWNGTSWSPLTAQGNIIGTTNQVNAAIFIGSNLYLGGTFTTIGGLTVNRIVKWDGTNWTTLGVGLSGNVNALAVIGADLYAGGAFTTSGGVSTNYISKWNGTSWSALGTGMNATPVTALAVSGTDLYAGGAFTTSGGVATNRVAKWNGTSWSALGTGFTSGQVNALSFSGSTLNAGGTFTAAGAVTVNYISSWNGTSWSALTIQGNVNGPNNNIHGAVFIGSNLYISGTFTTISGLTVNQIAYWDGTNWNSLGGGMSNNVFALATDGTNLYAGGSFTTSGGVTTNYIAKWNGTSWSALGAGMNNTVWSLLISGTDLYAGGAFTTSGGVTTNRVAKWNGTSWSALDTGFTSGQVSALSLIGSTLFAGGTFTTAGAVTVNYIASWNGTSWSALGTGMNASGVNALSVIGSDLYAGGAFTSSGGITTNRIAKWNGTSWSALGAGMNAQVLALTFIGSDLYAGGDFSTSGGITTYYITKWNGTSWSALGTGMLASVYSFAVSGTDLFTGGVFTTAGGVAVNRIAKWNGTSWSAVSGLAPIPGTNNTVNALAIDGSNNVIIGGAFTVAGLTTVNRIAKWNGTSWSALGGGMGTTSIYSLAFIGTDLYAGGDFTTSDGVTTNRIAKWNGTS